MKAKTAVSILLLGAFPGLALAAGDHVGGHDMSRMRHGGHDMPGQSQEMHDAAAGRPGDPAKVSRTIEVTMADTMRFTPDRIRVKAGETVRFFLRNGGNLRHEFVLGSVEELKEHAAIMRAQPDMKHADANIAAVGPGKVGGLVWQFDRSGTVDFACLVPGHFEAGMVGEIEVK